MRLRWELIVIGSIIVFLLAGFFNATAISFEWYGTQQQASCVFGEGCERVLSSVYASFLSLPLGIWGMIYYGVLVTISLIAMIFRKYRRYLLRGVGVGIMGGLIISLYLFYIQAVVLETFCSSCLLSLADIIIMSGIIITYYKYIFKSNVHIS